MKLTKESIFPYGDICFHRNDGENFFPHLHTHDFYEIFVVLEGRVSHSIDGGEEEVSAGSAVWIKPESCHRLHPEKGCEVLNLAFSEELAQSLLEDLRMERFGLSRICRLAPEEAEWLYAESKRAVSQPPETRDVFLKSMLVFCLSRFVAAPAPQKEDFPEWFSILLSRLSSPEVFTGSTREICRLAGYTPEYVSRCFRKYLDTTLTDYIRDQRIHYAAGLLASTTMPILEICMECGFKNLSYFYRCFHRMYGVSPKQYREQHFIIL